MNRSKVTGTIRDNVLHLMAQNTPHCKAICMVGEYIIQSGSIAKTREAGNIYKRKRVKRKEKCSGTI